MNIKELEQFEAVYQPSKEITFCWGVKKYVQLSVDENHTDIVDHANESLRIWQAAKAQAIPKGFVVVSTKDINIIYDQINDWNTDWSLVFGFFNRILGVQEVNND